MLRSLRSRLILSHSLPLLLVVPLMGIALIYMLETQLLLPGLSAQVMDTATVIAEIARDHPDIWSDRVRAEDFIARVKPGATDRLMLLDPNGTLLASSDPGDAERLGQPVELPGLVDAQAGKATVRAVYSQQLHQEIADALVPVTGPDQDPVGLVRVSYRLASIFERFLRLRLLVAGVLIAGLVLGAAVGWMLAVNLERPLRQVTQAIYLLASGRQLTPLTDQGPEEIVLVSRAVNSLVQQLHNLEEARRQLLANLVHELGRPIGAVLSAIQAMQRGADEDAALRRELLAGMQTEVIRLQRLLDDLTRLRESVLGTLELLRRPTPLSAWLAELLVTRREAAQAKKLHWVTTVPDDLPSLDVDPDRLAQAVGNLLSNAIKYTPAGGTVSVSAGVEDDAVWIRVSDTGPGIAAEELPRIFAPFYRGPQANRFPQGMGLGLPIAHDVVVAHGGRLDVESTPGVGSHFTIRLPVR